MPDLPIPALKILILISRLACDKPDVVSQVPMTGTGSYCLTAIKCIQNSTNDTENVCQCLQCNNCQPQTYEVECKLSKSAVWGVSRLHWLVFAIMSTRVCPTIEEFATMVLSAPHEKSLSPKLVRASSL